MSAVGGGFFGDLISGDPYNVTDAGGGGYETINVQTPATVQLGVIMDTTQVFFLAWNMYTALAPIRTPMRALEDPREDLAVFGVVEVGTFLVKRASSLEEGNEIETRKMLGESLVSE